MGKRKNYLDTGFIRKRMEQLELTRDDMATKLKVDKQRVHKWLQGKRNPSEEHIEGLAKFLGVGIEKIKLNVDEEDKLDRKYALNERGLFPRFFCKVKETFDDLQEVIPDFEFYYDKLGWKWPLDGQYIKKFEHKAVAFRHAYGVVRITLDQEPDSPRKTKLLFAWMLTKKIRLDSAEIIVADQEVQLVPFFIGEDQTVRLREDRSFDFANWFGGSPATYFIRSDSGDFEISEPWNGGTRDGDLLKNEHLIFIPAARHHRYDARKARARTKSLGGRT